MIRRGFSDNCCSYFRTLLVPSLELAVTDVLWPSQYPRCCSLHEVDHSLLRNSEHNCHKIKQNKRDVKKAGEKKIPPELVGVR